MKKIKVLLIALILVLGGAIFNSTYAANETRDLGADLTRPYNELDPKPKYQYTVGTVGGNLKYTIVKIYDAADKINNKLAYTKALYCLRGGKGFGANVQQNGTDISGTPISYTELGEMHTNAEAIIREYNNLYGVDLNRNGVQLKDRNNQNKEVNLYNAILWVLDESYLPTDKKNNQNEVVYSESEYKSELLDKAGIENDDSKRNEITKDDIEAIQQLAVWYFTNYDEQQSGIEPTVSQETMYSASQISIIERFNRT